MNFNVKVQKLTGMPDQFGRVEVRESSDSQVILIQGRNVASASFRGFELLLQAFGNVQIWILRDGQLSRILSSSSSIQKVKGKIKNGDVLYLLTDSIFENPDFSFLKDPESIFHKLILKKGDQGIVMASFQESHDFSSENVTSKVRQTLPVKMKIALLIDKIVAILPSPDLSVKEDFVHPKENKKRKIATSAGVILLILLIASIAFGVRQQKKQASRMKYASILDIVTRDLNDANSIVAADPIRARSLVLDANNQIQSLVSQGVKDVGVTKLAGDVANALEQIAGIYNEEPSLYLDLTLLDNSFKGDDMAFSDGRVVVLDRQGKRLESIDVGTSGANPVAGPDVMPSANLIAAYSDRNFVTSSDGTWDIESAKANKIISADPQVGSNILIYAYTGNIYVLDKNNSVVWKYQGDGGVFDTKQNWFGAGVKPDLINVTSWTIDGNVWMLTNDNQILRFSGGSPIDFSLKNLDVPLSATSIFTTQDSNYLYILDGGNSRILVIDKDGNYKGQYVSSNIKNATKIIVSEADRKIILLEGNKLYSLDVKNI